MPSERRRGDEFVTHQELREALQQLFDLKARVEPALRFFEAMRLLGVEELLPEILKDERTRQVLRNVSGIRWRRWATVAAVVGGFAGLAVIGDLAISVYLLFKVH